MNESAWEAVNSYTIGQMRTLRVDLGRPVIISHFKMNIFSELSFVLPTKLYCFVAVIPYTQNMCKNLKMMKQKTLLIEL